MYGLRHYIGGKKIMGNVKHVAFMSMKSVATQTASLKLSGWDKRQDLEPEVSVSRSFTVFKMDLFVDLIK